MKTMVKVTIYLTILMGVSLILIDFTCGIQFDASNIFAKGSFSFNNKCYMFETEEYVT